MSRVLQLWGLLAVTVIGLIVGICVGNSFMTGVFGGLTPFVVGMLVAENRRPCGD